MIKLECSNCGIKTKEYNFICQKCEKKDIKKDITKIKDTIKKNLAVLRGASLFLYKFTGYKPLALENSISELEKIIK